MIKRSPTSIEKVLESHLDCCFERLIQKGLLTSEELRYLLNKKGSSSDRATCLFLIINRILEALSILQIQRWDFDLWDKRWKDNEGKPAGREVYYICQDKRVSRKRGALSAIVRGYRKRCQEESEKLRERIYKASNFQELIALKREAVARGILIDDGKKIIHNHSWLDSKRVFTAYAEMFVAFGGKD